MCIPYSKIEYLIDDLPKGDVSLHVSHIASVLRSIIREDLEEREKFAEEFLAQERERELHEMGEPTKEELNELDAMARKERLADWPHGV